MFILRSQSYSLTVRLTTYSGHPRIILHVTIDSAWGISKVLTLEYLYTVEKYNVLDVLLSDSM